MKRVILGLCALCGALNAAEFDAKMGVGIGAVVLALVAYGAYRMARKHRVVPNEREIDEERFDTTAKYAQRRSNMEFEDLKKEYINFKDRLRFGFERLFYSEEPNIFLVEMPISFPEYLSYRHRDVVSLITLINTFLSKNFMHGTITTRFAVSQYRDIGQMIDIKISTDKPIVDRHTLTALQRCINDHRKMPDTILAQIHELLIATQVASNLATSASGVDVNLNFIAQISDKNVAPEPFSVQDRNVLICERSPAVAKNLSDILQSFGCAVVPKHDFETVRQHMMDSVYVPDLLFINANLANDEALEFLREYENHKRINFVIVKNDAQHSKHSQKLGFNVFVLHMPVFAEDIKAILELTTKS